MRNLLSYFRLLPLVIVVGFSLLTVKGFGLLREAQAEGAGTSMPSEQTDADATPASEDPAADDSEMASSAEVDVLTSLTKRRKQLDQREQDMAMRQNVITAAEQRVDTKIAQLQALQAEIQKLLGQRDAEEQKQIASLVKTYSAMKAKDAARIFDTLDNDVRIAVAQQMKSDVLAPVLAAMQADQAQKITLALANRFKVTPPPVVAAAPPAAPAPDGTQPPAAPVTTAANTSATTLPGTAPSAAAPAPAADKPADKPPVKTAAADPAAQKTADATPKPAPVHKPRPRQAAAKPPVKTAATDTAPSQTAALNAKSAAATHAPTPTTAMPAPAPTYTAPAGTPATAPANTPPPATKPGG